MRKLLTLICSITLFGVVVGLSSSSSTVQAAGSPWPWNTALPGASNPYFDVVYGNGLWVAVGPNGANRAMVTTDPTCTPVAPATSCWTPVDVGTEVSWMSVTYGEGIFVAVGRGDGTTEKLVMTSADGLHWSRQATPATHKAGQSPYWVDIEYANGLFMAFATRQDATGLYSVMTSPDGITWTEHSMPSWLYCSADYTGGCNQWGGVAYGNGVWVAVAADDYSIRDHKIARSTDDGATWTYVATPDIDQMWDDIIFTNNTFIVTSRGSGSEQVLVSTDNGVTWATRKTRLGGSSEIATDGTTVMTAVGKNSGSIYTDYVSITDLVNNCTASSCWTQNYASVSGNTPNWTELAYGAGIFVMVNMGLTPTVAYTGTSYNPSREIEVVTIDPNDGVSSATYQSGTSAAALVLPTLTRDGYTFAGWNSKKDGNGTSYTNGDSYTFSTSNTESTVIYAQWTPKSYTISFNTDGGSAVADASYTTGSTITLPAAPTKNGYTFAGWFAEQTGGSALGATYTPEGFGALTFYARWTLNPTTPSTTPTGGTPRYNSLAKKVGTNYSFAPVADAKGRILTVKSKTGSVCRALGERVVFVSPGRCTIQVLEGRSVRRTMSTTVVGGSVATKQLRKLTSITITFDGDSSVLSSAAKAAMKRAAARLRSASVVTVEAHATHDGSPTPDEANKLSADRAAVTATYLRSLGVKVMVKSSYGKTLPISTNPAKNRRAVISWYAALISA